MHGHQYQPSPEHHQSSPEMWVDQFETLEQGQGFIDHISGDVDRQRAYMDVHAAHGETRELEPARMLEMIKYCGETLNYLRHVRPFEDRRN